MGAKIDDGEIPFALRVQMVFDGKDRCRGRGDVAEKWRGFLGNALPEQFDKASCEVRSTGWLR